MWRLKLLIAIYVVAQGTNGTLFRSTEQCFKEAEEEYISCERVPDRPDSCDCEQRDPCYIKMVIKKDGTEYRINSAEREPGPTLIMKHNATIVVDVFNDNEDEISIHWHGMYQKYTPWMDGVGYITEWPVPGYAKYRYIFKADPYGTHWYHSHVGEQRDHGLYGALIVREPAGGAFRKVPEFIDDPSKYTILLREYGLNTDVQEPSTDREKRRACSPDGSIALGNFQKFGLILNGKKTRKNQNEVNIDLGTFHLEPGKTYRFRLIGSMKEQPLLFSIDYYKLIVIASEGCLINPFVTDVLNIHTGERYDFLVKTAPTGPIGFSVRTETAVVDCQNLSKPKQVGLWHLGNGEVQLKREISYDLHKSKTDGERCKENNPCTVLNCAFSPRIGQECHDVTELTALINEDDEVPENIDQEFFFSFAFNVGPSVNSKAFTLPSTPLQVTHHNRSAECEYEHLCKSSSRCVQIANIPSNKTNIRLVFSTPSVPHPIHLHGHSFFVAKIGVTNEDLVPHECGHRMKWKPGREPSRSLATSSTIRKDTLTVPKNKYAVVEFRADNPGYWFVHCHIDPHLMRGMALVIREKKRLQNPSPYELHHQQKEFCWTVKQFEQKMREGSELFNRNWRKEVEKEESIQKCFERHRRNRPFSSKKKFRSQFIRNCLRKFREGMKELKAFKKRKSAK